MLSFYLNAKFYKKILISFYFNQFISNNFLKYYL